jgi:MoxR-like ATPase
VGDIDDDIPESFQSTLQKNGIHMNSSLINRFLGAVFSKPFIILVGPTGCGKTALAEMFAKWITTKKRSVRVAVAPNWTGPQHLLGYPSDLADGGYHMTAAAQLLKQASEDQSYAHVLILDEMNLSNVDQYFAPYMSALESSSKTLHFHSSDKAKDTIPKEIEVPTNLFVIGTCNMDHAGQNLSPKVLDRAHVIEICTPNDMLMNVIDQTDTDDDLDWSVTDDDLDQSDTDDEYENAVETVAESTKETDAGDAGETSHQTNENAEANEDGSEEDDSQDEDFVDFTWERVRDAETPAVPPSVKNILKKLVGVEGLGTEVRAIKEIKKYVRTSLWLRENTDQEAKVALDEAILQKVLPKLNGGKELNAVLTGLELFTKNNNLKLSNEKVTHMLDSLRSKPFVSFFKRV